MREHDAERVGAVDVLPKSQPDWLVAVHARRRRAAHEEEPDALGGLLPRRLALRHVRRAGDGLPPDLAASSAIRPLTPTPRVSVEPVTLIPQCTECQQVWLAGDGERWRAYWIDDGPEEKLIFYCPECAEREFGPSP